MTDLPPEPEGAATPMAFERACAIGRLRAALIELERWTGYPMPEHVRAMLEPGDLYDVEPESE